MLDAALHTLRSQIQRDPEIVLRYLSDMGAMSQASDGDEWWNMNVPGRNNRETRPISVVRVPPAGEDRKAKENRARVVVREGQPGRVVEVHPADRARSGERRESLRPDRPDVTLRLQDLEPRGGEVGTLALGAVDERVYRFTDLLDVDVLRPMRRLRILRATGTWDGLCESS